MSKIFNIFLSHFHSKIVELEEELRVVGNNLKSLEVSEEKVNFLMFPIFQEKKSRINLPNDFDP
jgi:hypothetical protein